MGSKKVWSGLSDDGLTIEAWTRPGAGDLELFVFDANPGPDGATGIHRVLIPARVIEDLVAERLPNDHARTLLDFLLGTGETP